MPPFMAFGLKGKRKRNNIPLMRRVTKGKDLTYLKKKTPAVHISDSVTCKQLKYFKQVEHPDDTLGI